MQMSSSARGDNEVFNFSVHNASAALSWAWSLLDKLHTGHLFVESMGAIIFQMLRDSDVKIVLKSKSSEPEQSFIHFPLP